jgi:hypothetical protein
MVYDTKTYKVFHHLTEDGQFQYFAMLEHKADELLFKKKQNSFLILQLVITVQFLYICHVILHMLLTG